MYYIRIADESFTPGLSTDLYQLIIDLDTSDTNECNDSFSESTEINCGEEIMLAIFDSGDQDFYTLELMTNSSLEVRVAGIPEFLPVRAILYDEVQNPVSTKDGSMSDPIEIIEDNLEPGTYYIAISSTSSSSSNEGLFSLSVTCGDATSVNETRAQTVEVFPNPVTSSLYIEKTISSMNYKYSIFNTSGVAIIEGDSRLDTSINVSSLNKGVYFIQIISMSGEYYLRKFFKIVV